MTTTTTPNRELPPTNVNAPTLYDWFAERGYTSRKVPEEWEDIGGPENGPKLVGHPAYTEWTKPDTNGTSVHVLIECPDGVIADEFTDPVYPDDMPF